MLFYRARVSAAAVQGSSIRTVDVVQDGGPHVLRFAPAYVLDATELGDLLPLLPVPYVSGAESRDQTGEPHAPRRRPSPASDPVFYLPVCGRFLPGSRPHHSPPAQLRAPPRPSALHLDLAVRPRPAHVPVLRDGRRLARLLLDLPPFVVRQSIRRGTGARGTWL